MPSGQQVLIKLRKMIISGELKGGKRIAEIPTAELLGVSRQPIRIAFRILEQEGILIKNPTRGYTIREISNTLVHQALEVRGVLEGLAAKNLAEKGLTQQQKQIFLECIQKTEKIFEKDNLTDDDLEIYHHYNLIFHDTIIKGTDNLAILQALAKNNQLPMASAQAFTYDDRHKFGEFRRLQYAHLQHCAIYDALVHKNSTVAENLMREHSQVVILGQKVNAILSEELLDEKIPT